MDDCFCFRCTSRMFFSKQRRIEVIGDLYEATDVVTYECPRCGVSDTVRIPILNPPPLVNGEVA